LGRGRTGGGMKRTRLGVLISGSGSNLQALIDSCAAPDYPAKIQLVLSNKADAFGLQRAAGAGIDGAVLSHKGFGDRESFERALTRQLESANIELVVLAGFMRILTPYFVERWRDRLINIHPSLLPSFKGTDTHAQALKAGVKLHGCSVHYVRPGLDDGPIIGQAAVPVLPTDDPKSLAARVLIAEHKLYPACVRAICEGRVKLVDEICHIWGADGSFAPLINSAL